MAKEISGQETNITALPEPRQLKLEYGPIPQDIAVAKYSNVAYVSGGEHEVTVTFGQAVFPLMHNADTVNVEYIARIAMPFGLAKQIAALLLQHSNR